MIETERRGWQGRRGTGGTEGGGWPLVGAARCAINAVVMARMHRAGIVW